MKRETLTMGWRGKCEAVVDYVVVDETPVPAAANRVAPVARTVAAGPWTAPDPLDLCLELWKAWLSEGPDRLLAAKTMRGLSGDGDGHGVDLHEAQRANDTRIAQATDAMIDSMQRIHIWAIYTMCSQATPWRFPNASFVDVAQEARSELQRLLKNNVCTAVLF